MTTRIALTLALALAAPIGARAQVAAAAPVAAQPAAAPQPAIAPAPAQAPTPAPAPRSRNDARPEERAREVEDRLEAMKQRRFQRDQEWQSKGVNIRIETTVIESKGEQVTGRKLLSVTTIDGDSWSSVRSTQNVPLRLNGGSVSYRPAPLNMDARAFLRDDGRIKVELTVEYRAGSTPEGPGGNDALDEGIKQSVSAVLESGKPLLLAQSADAVGDRRVALEVKATVLK